MLAIWRDSVEAEGGAYSCRAHLAWLAGFGRERVQQPDQVGPAGRVFCALAWGETAQGGNRLIKPGGFVFEDGVVHGGNHGRIR